MKRHWQDWPRPILWGVAGAIILCGWCSLFSGVGGWLVGYELGYRQARTEYLPEIGVLVTRVEQDSPAYSAGITRGDTILAINGSSIADAPMLLAELSSYQPGEQVQITYRQHMTERITTVLLANHPDQRAARPYLGIYYTARADQPADA